MRSINGLFLLAGLAAGCGGDARLELSAADGIRAAATQMDLTLREYHDEVDRADTDRETGVVSAFVTRVKTDRDSDEALDEHASLFQAALGKIRKDREVEWSRHAAARDNVAVLREMARGLERMGIASLTLQDEMRRYLTSWLDAKHAADAAESAKGDNP